MTLSQQILRQGLSLRAAAGHSGDLVPAAFRSQRGAQCIGGGFAHDFGDLEVFPRAGSQLGPMSDEEHLVVSCQGLQPVRQLVEGHAADPGIHFIKNIGDVFLILTQPGQSEEKAGKLAARGNAVQRLRRLARIGGPEQAAAFIADAGPKLMG